ncbi:hypothetical protein CLV46_0344 [Diaminobutyricimonas aerilata]|uniref:Secreted protein n=1 Tax=Diaminobutyricimonas aerilata TaxID=1162967 RepID=A0A2M9CFV4_9MICO|nr:hypothetical protein [Diaminobutyricimonas aerilata]PJJ70816.1 hypothetical protein CLV46_0344 [Diaminobutyricimonas aerilata]
MRTTERGSRHARLLIALAFAMTVGLGGCAAPAADDDVASIDSGESGETEAPDDGGTAEGDGVAFAECMREQGVDVGDPGNGEGLRITMPEGVSPEEAEAAMEECREYLPDGGRPRELDPEQLAAQLEFSKCMRENGVEDFPDPDESGRIRIERGQGGGSVDTDFAAAEEACRHLMPARPGGGPVDDTEDGE